MNRIAKTFAPSIVLMMPRMFYRGIILWLCWAWFISPLFNIPEIPLWYAVPISGLISMLTFEKIGEIHDVQEAWIKVGQWSIGATVFLASAWLMHVLAPGQI